MALLRAVDAAEADAFRVLVVQDFEGVAVEEEDDGAGEVGKMEEADRRRIKQANSNFASVGEANWPTRYDPDRTAGSALRG